jgi:hypothetical protein
MTYIYVHIKLPLNIKLSIVQCHLTKYIHLQCTKPFQYIRILPEHVVRKSFSYIKKMLICDRVFLCTAVPPYLLIQYPWFQLSAVYRGPPKN